MGDDAIIAAYLAGEKTRAIYAVFGIGGPQLYRLLRRYHVPLRGPSTTMRVPVYDETGTRLTETLTAAAALLRCVPSNLLQHHLAAYGDGYQLTSRPDPAYTGRRARWRRRDYAAD